jgi:hypothetical protein
LPVLRRAFPSIKSSVIAPSLGPPTTFSASTPTDRRNYTVGFGVLRNEPNQTPELIERTDVRTIMAADQERFSRGIGATSAPHSSGAHQPMDSVRRPADVSSTCSPIRYRYRGSNGTSGDGAVCQSNPTKNRNFFDSRLLCRLTETTIPGFLPFSRRARHYSTYRKHAWFSERAKGWFASLTRRPKQTHLKFRTLHLDSRYVD